jgi:steroid delta-isomerase
VLDRTVIEATIRAYAAAWGVGDREAWLATFAEHATQEDPVGEEVRRGHEEIGEFWDKAMARYKSLEILPRDIFIVGREAAMEWTINAVADDGAITFNGVDVFRFDESGNILSVRAYWERTRIEEQRQRLARTRGTVWTKP